MRQVFCAFVNDPNTFAFLLGVEQEVSGTPLFWPRMQPVFFALVNDDCSPNTFAFLLGVESEASGIFDILI